jgi:hypothetical protein
MTRILIAFILCAALVSAARAQTAGTQSSGTQTAPRPQRPSKNQPQLPNIIDLENKSAAPKTAAESSAETAAQQAALVRAVESLASEVRTLVQEMRALNVRQQAQLDLLRLTRGDLRIDSYERELKSTNERLAQVSREEQQLRAALTPEGLLQQASRVGSIDRDATIRAIKGDLEGRLGVLMPEKQQLELRKAELEAFIVGFRDTNERAERRLDLVDEALRQVTTPPATEENKTPPGKPDR